MTRLRRRSAPGVRVEIRGELPRQDAEYAGDGRGRILYRRCDGHYGLITPIADPH
ncbi:hypothetical protein [Kitasatospora purpeofusca]|uniref:hypothetical protein n=1 Tax=Kitasatospora purpeofusca TaxID=67352 RepID=UPI002A598C4D|nr:hypothetical protein [Kitasatospora purpeofusca]MDY0814934.1 hypothetical protein [Kitasatospora purpeofusca]